MSPPQDEYAIAIRVVRALEKLGIEYCLGGSLASSLQGQPRSTNDIDFAVRIAQHHVAPLVAELGSDFEVDDQGLLEAIRLRRSHNLICLPTVLKIDFFVRGGDSFDESELSRRIRVRTGSGELFVATPEDNILRKPVWFRKGDEVSDRQWRDVLGMLRAGRQNLDRD